MPFFRVPKKEQVLDYSYLDRISGDSNVLHREVLEDFILKGNELIHRLDTDEADRVSGEVTSGLIDFYAKLRLLGLKNLLKSAEKLEEALEDGRNNSNFLKKYETFKRYLSEAVSEASRDLLKYKAPA